MVDISHNYTCDRCGLLIDYVYKGDDKIQGWRFVRTSKNERSTLNDSNRWLLCKDCMDSLVYWMDSEDLNVGVNVEEQLRFYLEEE